MEQKLRIWKCVVWAAVLAGMPVVFIVFHYLAKLCQMTANRTINANWNYLLMGLYCIMGLCAAGVASIGRHFLHNWIVRFGGLIGLLLSAWFSALWILTVFAGVGLPGIQGIPLYNFINYASMTILFGVYLALSARMIAQAVRDRRQTSTIKKSEKTTRLLFVIDMQNDFIDGALGTAEAVQIVPHVVEKVRRAAEAGAEIWFTQDTHTADYANTQEGRNLPVPHCIEGTPGWELCSALQPYAENARCVKKGTFGAAELARTLQGRTDIAEIELCGLCTDICVISNALLLKAVLPEAPISVDAACCAGVTPDSHQTALDAMKMCQIQINRE